MQDLAIDLSRVALKRRRTKIVATVGPASSTVEALAGLIEAGVDVFRLNFSHGTHESHGKLYAAIREASARTKKQVAVLGDLCGPKIRVGTFEGGGIDLQWGSEVVVTVREVEGKPGLIHSEYRSLAADVVPGDRILLDDGRLQLQVKQVEGTEIRCDVQVGGRLTDKKGMNLPGVRISAPALTEKDKADAAFAVKLGVDYLALSFVRAPTDVADLKALLRDLRAETPVIAKIEKPEALDTIGGILEVADAIMVARGDLGVEMAEEEVPLIQQELVRLAVAANRPVIVATQMLESMIENARPTRAEVTDVAAAALSRADAVMLSAETASGKHPREAVATMDRVLRMVEGYQWKRGQHGKVMPDVPLLGNVQAQLNAALSRATSMLSGELEVRAVVAPTRTGRMARLISSARPAAPVLALTSSETLCRRLQLLWGVAPEMASPVELEAPAPLARAVVQRLGLATPGQHILLVWDASPERSGLAPTVSILSV
jgi:pyruvate kinase